MKAMRFAAGLFVLVALAGCQAAEPNGDRETVYKLPPEVIQLYNEGTPAGWMELEVEADGTIFESEAEISYEKVPSNVKQAAEAELPGGQVTGAEAEYVNGTRAYEVRKTVDGQEYELVFSEDGTLLEKEVSLDIADAPAEVIENAQAAIPGGEIKSVERIEHPDKEIVYHVKLEKDGASYKVVLSEAGEVLRKVREAKAELEIPLD
jgi:uncharacterized membrane protein YkoI